MTWKPERWVSWSLGGVLVVATTIRLWYLQQGFLELSPDEAHYWEWSRRLDWSYYSKGPFVAYLIALSTALGGSTELFVRLPAVILSAGTTVGVFALIKALFADAKLALATAIVLQIVPLFAAGAVLMTIDPPLIFFWTLMLWLVCRALAEDRTAYWYAAGIALACGLLSKYAMAYVVLSIWLFLVTSRRYQGWLRRKEPYVMLAIGMAGFSPVIIWNLRHGAVSLKHVMGQADVHQGLSLQLSFSTLGEFVGSQALALSPLLFVWMLIAMALTLWEGLRQRDERWLFLFWGWAPTFVLMLALSLRQKVQANWAAPAYLTAFIAATAYGWYRWRALPAGLWKHLGLAGASLMILLAVGMTAVLHDPALFLRLGLQPSADPLARLRGWQTLARAVEAHAVQMPQAPFLLSDRYQISSELAFYVRGHPQTFSVNLGRRMNQYDLWDGLPRLAGHDAIYVQPDNAELPQALRATFQRCDEGQPVVIKALGVELKRFYLFPCWGFSGVPPQPDQVRY